MLATEGEASKGVGGKRREVESDIDKYIDREVKVKNEMVIQHEHILL